MSDNAAAEESVTRVTRVIDFRIPLWGLMTTAGVVGWGLTSMWFSVQQLVRTVDDLQITVKSGNTSVSVLASEVALLKFRLGTTEEDIKRLNEMVRTQTNRR